MGKTQKQARFVEEHYGASSLGRCAKGRALCGKKNAFMGAVLMLENDHYAKTGSGQTQETVSAVEKKGVFCRVLSTAILRCCLLAQRGRETLSRMTRAAAVTSAGSSRRLVRRRRTVKRRAFNTIRYGEHKTRQDKTQTQDKTRRSHPDALERSIPT